MPLETASTIAQLNAANPIHTDGLSQADAHLRLLKTVLQAQFPNWTAAALASTNADIDSAVAAVVTNGVAKLADAGVFFKTNTTDGFTNPAAGEIDIRAGAQIVAKLKSDLTAAFTGAVSAPSVASSFTGPGCTPIGGTIVWWSDTLPTGSGTWAFCNGGTYLRSNTALFGILGTFYGTGDGTTTANLPDLRDNVPVGKGTMGATSAVGRITNFATSTLGALFGECLHLLGLGELPAHNHGVNDPGHVHAPPTGSHFLTDAPGVQALNSGNVSPSAANTASATTGITIQNAGGGASHNNVQPAIVCNWIMRIA